MYGSSFYELRNNKKISKEIQDSIIKLTLFLFILILGTFGVSNYFVESRLASIWKRYNLPSGKGLDGWYYVSAFVSFTWLVTLFIFLPRLISDYWELRKRDNFIFWDFFVSRFQLISGVLFSVLSFFLVFAINPI